MVTSQPEQSSGKEASPWWRRPVAAQDRISLMEVAALAIVCGAGAGYIEGAILLVRRYLLGQFIFTTPMVVWMAPLAYLFVFAPMGLGVLILRLIFRRQIGIKPVALAFGAWGAFGITALLLDKHIHPLAVLVITIGLGVQFSRMMGNRAVRRLILPVAVVLLGVTGSLTLGSQRALAWLETRRVAGLPDARPGAPNVLFIIWDTVRSGSLSLYGYDRPTTPYLETWAAEGVVFDQAIAPGPWTLPSHATMFTGHPAHELSTDFLKPLDRVYPTLAEAFRTEGYLTVAMVANVIYTSRDGGVLRGFDHQESYGITRAQLRLSPELAQAYRRRQEWRNPHRFYARSGARSISDRFLRWLDARGDQPYFAFLNYYDAHRPYLAPPELREKFANPLNPQQGWYDAAIAKLDAELERLLGELDRRGELDNTIVVLTSDHGELFGEHDLTGHANALYLPLLRVPLVMWCRTCLPRERRIVAPVSLTDIAATVSSLTGLTPALPFPGHSLAKLWGPDSSSAPGSPLVSSVTKGIRVQSHFPVQWGPMASLVEGGYHYILDSRGKQELFDLSANLDEAVNLIEGTTGSQIARDMRRSLEETVATALPGKVPVELEPER